MDIEEQLKIVAHLSERVHDAFSALKTAEARYLNLVEEHGNRKEIWLRSVDVAYEEGKVIGKNEREREAHLRKLLPTEYNEMIRVEAIMRGAEREYRMYQRDVERLTLQVQIAKIVNDLRVLQWKES